VLVRLGVTVFLRQTEIDQMNNMRLVGQPDQEVLRLDISMDVVLRMQPLDPLQELVSED
jgi:hypothetical protein